MGGVCLLLLLSVALGASAQEPPLTTGPVVDITAAPPTEPPVTPFLTTIVPPTPAPTDLPMALPPTVAPETTTTAVQVQDEGGQEETPSAGPTPAPTLLPLPPPAPTDASDVPPITWPPPPPPPPPTGTESGDDDGGQGVGRTEPVAPDVTPLPTSWYDRNNDLMLGNGTSEDGLVLPPEDSPVDEMPVMAVMVAVSSLLVIIFIIIILYMLRFKRYKQASHANSFRLTNGKSDETELQSVPLLARSPSTNRKYPPLPVDKLEEEMNRRMADDNKLFREEFNSLPVCPIQPSCDAASKEENKEKNRYVNILPYDHSRVHLSSLEGVPDSDFVNASFVNNTATIVMVTNLKERKECKCAQYWPDQGCWTYGNIRVSVEDVMVLVDYTIRKFCIQQVGDLSGKKPQRLITQLHFTSWPDFGVPFTPIGMLKFLKKVKNNNPQYAGAILVHCSAGVGRTGTFIVIDAMLDMMNAERKVDVFGFVTRIRAQRCQMVQTDMQYVFIFQALLEHYLYGDTELEVTSLESHLAKLYAPSPSAGCGGLEKLTSIKIQNDKMRTGNLPANMKKNRVLQIIPYEFNRVIIPVKRGEENTDYVNASFIDGYRQKDSYIASQGPLQHTMEDFWRMIWEWRSCSIVMLTELEERGQEKCAQYWPSDGAVVYGDVSIEIKREEENESYTVRDLLVTNNRENKARAVRQFHFHGWPEVGIPSDGKGMINIIAAVQKQQQQSGNHPITVHCSAGAGRTGTFCALSTVLERVKAEGILDVFQTVKSLRLQRPHMVQTLEQYEFCYKVVQEYIDAFSDYANFK
ncbi:hypothetical protein NHX12_029853 [Muraenolepis orangiensis]|uniref:protein-tyrosine-phosphatase n=1 Tax=Muraenolepis orangiensis TaxID=630683 RepID=A0A9Q0IKG6_9TELE|nr:hypothetical protein NHX12_029853 [Muraenolepis orangiensis]